MAEKTKEKAQETFEDNDALLQHILSKKPEEKLVNIPEWGVELLCKTLDAEGRLAVEAKAYDKETKRTYYKRAFDLVVMYGCYNPANGQRFFQEEHLPFLRENGGPTVLLGMTILNLSHMLGDEAENTKKN